MQDLFQLGSLLQRAGTASEPGRSSRRTSGQKEADEYSEIPSFDALLAIAATFADNASDQNSQNPINQNAASVVGPVQGDSESSSGSTPVDIRDLLGPFTPESSQPIGEGMNVSGIGRIDRSGIEADGTGAPGIPLGFEYRRVSRSIPVSVENVGLSRDGAMFGTDSSTTSRQVRLMDQMDDTIGEGHSLDGNLDTRADIERLPRWRNAPMTGEPSDTGYGDDGLTGPDLQIIARNDNPTRPPARHIAPPDLRIVGNSPQVTEWPVHDDLVDRLAGTWEQSFIPTDEDAFPGDHSLDFMPDILDRGITTVQPASLFEAIDEPGLRLISRRNSPATPSNEETDLDAAGIDGAEKAERALLDGFAQIDDAVPPARDVTSLDAHGASSRRAAHSAAVDDASIRVSPAPVPLFGEFLPVDVEAATGDNREPAVSVRQAVMEISRELRHLEETGGPELSFSLRLHPEHLGEVEVEIQRVNDVWSISIVTAHEEARDVLAAEISRLEHRFREHHLNLDAITVVSKTPESSIIAPAANEQSAGTDFQQTGQSGYSESQNQDESGWRKDGSTTILGIDPSHDVDTVQDVTHSHRSISRSGVDIKA